MEKKFNSLITIHDKPNYPFVFFLYDWKNEDEVSQR